MIFNAWKKDEAQRQIILFQHSMIGLLFVLCIVLAFGWMSAPSRLVTYIPPDISNGATQKANEVPKTYLYSFAYQLWQEINYWPTEGSINYGQNIHSYWSYLTPEFRDYLLQDNEDLKVSGQLQRERMMQGLPGTAFDETHVKQINRDLWEVTLTMRLTEHRNNQLIKDVEISYCLKVARLDVSRAHNPFGLVLAGFGSEPVRVKTYV